MGQRLRLLWHLGRHGDRSDRTELARGAAPWWCAPVRRFSSGWAPVDVAASPVTVTRGAPDRSRGPGDHVSSSGDTGGEYQVEHRGEVSVARGDRRRVPVPRRTCRCGIDLWGDEGDRLTEFDPGDKRSVTDPRGGSSSSGAGRCCRPLPCKPGPGISWAGNRGVGPSGSGWPRRQLFDGMESWLPWLCDEDRVLPDLLGDGSRVVLIDPRRMRDRAAELNDEEAALAGALAVTWGVVEGGPSRRWPSRRWPRR